MYLQEIYIQIDYKRYHFLKFVLEGYDGLCLLSTVPGKRDCVCLRYPSERENLLFKLLASLVPSIERSLP